MKICSTCHLEKDETEFHKNKNRKDGLQYQCKSCSKIRDAKSYSQSAKRQQQIKTRRNEKRSYNRKLTQRFKRFCGCKLCKEREPLALDLHHIDPSGKDKDPSKLYSYSTEKLRIEIKKCVVLCANCHRKVHAGLLKI